MIVPHVFPSRVFQFFSLLSYRAVDEEGSEDNDSQQHWAGGLDNLEVAVLVGEEDHHRETADDDALEDEEDGPEDHVEGDNTGRAVLTVVTALSTLETLELCLKVVECQVLSLQTTHHVKTLHLTPVSEW